MTQDGPGDGGERAPAPEAPTEAMPEGLLAPGQVLGDRYQIRSQLGRGGMGEVWRAFDLKLRVEVALKALREDLFKDEGRRDLLRREVRAAREVVSPNVCRIFDLIEADGSELVSMEYVDGGTLLEVLQERGPLDLKEAQDIASQFLAGLEAIHKAGLVHRDVKPENIMLTRAGRVVLMDFGLARQEDSGAGTVSGTPAYMAPEQAAGLKVDARADVYSAGVVLAEMVSPEGIKNLQSRQSVWEGIRHEPARVPDSPWAPVLKKAVAKEPDNRFNSAHTLIRALEDVTLREKGADEVTPYPGLAFFTEADAEYFYGREAEVERMWRTLDQPYLFAIIGPSGAGKSSFLRAGLIPAGPQGWSFVVATPGSSPFVQLVQALVPEFSGDTEAILELVRTDDSDAMVSAVGRWRAQHDQAVLVVDQFEELFTLNSPEVQTRFADLLARLALEADVHVLLSMRDDFLFHCQAHEALRPVFAEITPLGPPVGGALRRALVQPASKCGYRFENDDLVEDMLAEVEGERGLLPLLAFAVNRLWEERDSDAGLLTREAYERIGGVGGALARHAEETLERVGEERAPMVRELFRNLMTAQGTRAVRDLDELLSVFESSDRESAAEVLRELVDARLLTTFEVESEGEEATHRVEIIHESLLSSWPRLVGWRTQDADAARLRDEVRQAARTWDEHERPNDLLWAGSAYREFASWRERYPGGLSETEESFARAMIAHVKRRRRRRRVAVAAAFAVLIAGLAIVGSFWQRSVREARRAEASELVALGRLELESYPSAAIAYTITSLELADRPAARRLALEALWKGPTAIIVNDEVSMQTQFTSDGRWLVQSHVATEASPLRLIGADGSSLLPEHTQGNHFAYQEADFESGIFGLREWDEERTRFFPTVWSVWSAPENRRLAEARYEPGQLITGRPAIRSDQRRMITAIREEDGRVGIDTLGFDGDHNRLGTIDLDLEVDEKKWLVNMNRRGRWIAASTGHDVYVIEIGDHGLSQPRLLGRQEASVTQVDMDERGRFVATTDAECRIRLWDLDGTTPPTRLQGPPAGCRLWTPPLAAEDFLGAWGRSTSDGDIEFWIWSLVTGQPQLLRRFDMESGGRIWLNAEYCVRGESFRKVHLWPIAAPADAEPLSLLRGETGLIGYPRFHPNGKWLVVPEDNGLFLWPLARPYPAVIRRHDGNVWDLVFGPGGRWLASCSADGTVRVWPLGGQAPPPGRILSSVRGPWDLARSPDGRRLLVSTEGGARLLSVGDDSPITLADEDIDVPGGTWFTAFSRDGRLAAFLSADLEEATRKITIWDLASREQVVVLAKGGLRGDATPQFIGNEHLMSLDNSGLRRWNIDTGETDLLFEGTFQRFAVSEDRRRVLLLEAPTFKDAGRAIFVDLETGVATPLESHGNRVEAVALDIAGTFAVTGDRDGVVRVGPVTGEEPHVLFGHENSVDAVAIDPNGRWIASGGWDKTVRLWPMPDLSRPPLHTLPYDELISKLKTLTNLRVVQDKESATGWKLTHDPFPGWETVPTW